MYYYYYYYYEYGLKAGEQQMKLAEPTLIV